MGKTPFGAPLDVDDPHQAYDEEMAVAVTRLDADFISAVASSYGYSGGAHPNSWSDGFNAFRQTGAAFDPVTAFGAKGIENLIAECRRQVIENQSDIYGDLEEAEAVKQLEEGYPGAVKENVTAGRRWHFDAEGGHVRFDSYAVAPYSSGPSECLIDADLPGRLARVPGLAAKP